jgi:hypothetical protein
MTTVGGTGLCCFQFLYVVYWGGYVDKWGFVHSERATLYLADSGRVVQADVGSSLDANRQQLSHPCSASGHKDKNGVFVGSWCFSYAGAVHDLIIADIGNHSPWVRDPDYIAPLFQPSEGKTAVIIHRVSLSAKRAVYKALYRGSHYQITVVPAFPRLLGSVWELVDVRLV